MWYVIFTHPKCFHFYRIGIISEQVKQKHIFLDCTHMNTYFFFTHSHVWNLILHPWTFHEHYQKVKHMKDMEEMNPGFLFLWDKRSEMKYLGGLAIWFFPMITFLCARKNVIIGKKKKYRKPPNKTLILYVKH